MQYPQHFQGYPQMGNQQFPPPFSAQQMGFPQMPYVQQNMPFHVVPQLPPNVGSRTLWVGDMDEWMNEPWLHGTFSMGGHTVTDVKVIRQRPSGQHAGYGFVEFASQYEAQNVLNNFNGRPITQHPSGKVFRLNWATHGLSGGKGTGGTAGGIPDHNVPEFSLFVGDLAQDVTDYQLMMAFRQHYQSVRSAKVVFDPVTGMSKGYGFVKFAEEEDKERAMREMNGTYISTRQIRCSHAQKKADMAAAAASSTARGGAEGVKGMLPGVGTAKGEEGPGLQDPNNTTIFVGGLDHTVNDTMLHLAFSRFGALVYVRVPPGKACGFVQFVERASAEEALKEMQGFQMNMCRLRVSWGRATRGRGSGRPDQAKDPQEAGAEGGGRVARSRFATEGWTLRPVAPL